MHRWLAASVLAATLLSVGACGKDPKPPATPTPSTSASVDFATTIKNAMERLHEGTWREPDPTPRPAAKNKKLALLSAGQSSPTVSIPIAAAQEAARALGWEVQIFDAQNNPANAPKLVRDAMAAGMDGMITTLDCPAARSAFAEAKARGMKIVPLYAFDCNDPVFGGGGPQLFSDYINYGALGGTQAEATLGYGSIAAAAIIAATGGKAKVLIFNDPSFTALRYTTRGFKSTIERCPGCEVLAEINYQPTDIGPVLQQKVAAALAKYPQANAIRSPNSTATQLGIAPAVAQAGKQDQMFVFGGEAAQQDLDLIRTNKGLDACAASDSPWTGWAAVDTINSIFLGQAPKQAGLGTVVIDKAHNLPPSGPYKHTVDYRAIFKRAWGVP